MISREANPSLTGLEANRIQLLAGSTLTEDERAKFATIVNLVKKAEINCIKSIKAVEPVQETSVAASSVCMRWAIT